MVLDVVELARKHPDLVARLLTKSTGAIGEILVADHLVELGYTVAPTNNNACQSDLWVQSPAGNEFSVEVKCDRQRRPTWFVRARPCLDASSIWVLVSAPREPTAFPDPDDVEMFVLTVKEARALWDKSEWNARNPEDGDLRRWQIPDDAFNAWRKLPD
jgi:hypothetical protein